MFTVAYTYHIPMNSWGLVIAISTLIAVLVLVVIVQLTNLAKTNVVEGLKVE